MKMRHLSIWAGLLVWALASGAWAAGNVKAAVADMGRLIRAHPDARAAETAIKKCMDEFEAEQKQLLEDMDRMKADLEKAREEAQNKALSEEARQKKMKTAEEKLARLREFDQKAREAVLKRQREISDQQRRLREGIVTKLQKAIKEYAEKNGLTLVMNSGGSGSGAEAVVYHAESVDISDDIVKMIGGELKETKEPKAKEGKE